MESSTDDFGVQSLTDSMLDSDAEVSGIKLSSSPKDMDLEDPEQQVQTAELSRSDQQERQRQPVHRGSRDSEISSSSSGTILGTTMKADREGRSRIALDLSKLDPMEFPAIIPRDPFTSHSKVEDEPRKPPIAGIVRPAGTPPRTSSRSQTRNSSPPHTYHHYDHHHYDQDPTGLYSYPSPNSSTFSIHSSFISVSSLSRGSSRGSSPFDTRTGTPADREGEEEGEESNIEESNIERSNAREQEQGEGTILGLRSGTRSRPGDGEGTTRGRRNNQDRDQPTIAEGQDVSLVLPSISLPGSIHARTLDFGARLLDHDTSGMSSQSHRGARSGSAGEGNPLDIALIGRGGSSNAFVNALRGCGGVRCFAVNGEERERTGFGREVAVFEAGDEEGEGQEGRLAARLTIFDDETAGQTAGDPLGQVSNSNKETPQAMVSSTCALRSFLAGLVCGRTVIHQAQQTLTSRYRDAIVGA
jgi:hypothetical protein